MKEITLSDVTDEQLATQSQLLVSMLRSKFPKLDLRRGTVLRDLLVDTDAAIAAWSNAQAEEQRKSSSLLVQSERAANGEEVDVSDVNAILSNFNMSAVEGTRARGYVRVHVSTSNQHTVRAGITFTTTDELEFTTTADVTASVDPVGTQVKQHRTASGWWYLVPVEATSVGVAWNISAGTALEPRTPLADFTSASAYGTFSGGSDLETLDDTVARIRPSLSVRSFTSATAVEAVLRDAFDTTDNPIVAVSVCGFGNDAQLRDKHNLFGVAVGGRADVYVRNFTGLPVSRNLPVVGTLVGEPGAEGATYSLSIPHDIVPGLISIYSVTDAGSTALSSYKFSTVFKAALSDTWHDFRVDTGPLEVANTVWRDAEVTVSGVPVLESQDPAEHPFRVDVVALPVASELQALFDEDLVRNIGSDFVVRGPFIVNVSVNAVVRHLATKLFDTEGAKAAICKYVNETGFPGRLTRSEIVSILRDFGALSVDLHDEDAMLYGYVRDASNSVHEMSGDALDLSVVRDPKGMLTENTSAFVLESKNIQITTIPVN